MVVVAIFALIYREWAGVMVVLSDFGGQLGFFAGVVNNLMAFADPASFGFVNLVRV